MAVSKSSRTVEARKRSRKPKELHADRSPLLAVQASREDDPHSPSVQDRAQANPQHACFRPGKSCCSQVLNLTQHIEDGFELGQITGAAFIDLIAAYDTINHRRLFVKLVMLTDDVPLTESIRTMLSNRRFKVELNGKQRRWRNQRNGLPQGSVLSPLLFNVCTNDQPLPVATNSFIYADDLRLTTQQKTFEQVKTTLSSGLNELGVYYNENHLRPSPAKTQLRHST